MGMIGISGDLVMGKAHKSDAQIRQPTRNLVHIE